MNTQSKMLKTDDELIHDSLMIVIAKLHMDTFIQSKWSRITNETPRQYWNHAFRCYYAAERWRISDEDIKVIKQLWATSNLPDPVDHRDHEEHHRWAVRYFAIYQADKPDTYVPDEWRPLLGATPFSWDYLGLFKTFGG